MTHNEPLLKPGAWITLPPNDAPMRNNIATIFIPSFRYDKKKIEY